MSILINIYKDFDEFPGLRNCDISDRSGEQFYHQCLNGSFKRAFENKEKLIVNLDGTAGYASSFLDEAFGNLVYDFYLDNVKKYLEIISVEEPHWKEMIVNKTFLEWEDRRKRGNNPKVTATHPAWYRFDGNSIKLQVWELPA